MFLQIFVQLFIYQKLLKVLYYFEKNTSSLRSLSNFCASDKEHCFPMSKLKDAGLGYIIYGLSH